MTFNKLLHLQRGHSLTIQLLTPYACPPQTQLQFCMCWMIREYKERCWIFPSIWLETGSKTHQGILQNRPPSNVMGGAQIRYNLISQSFNGILLLLNLTNSCGMHSMINKIKISFHATMHVAAPLGETKLHVYLHQHHHTSLYLHQMEGFSTLWKIHIKHDE